MNTSKLLINPATALIFFATLNVQAFYNPTVGHWLSRDPIQERGGQNLYGFANNQPINKLDKNGLLIPQIVSFLQLMPDPRTDYFVAHYYDGSKTTTDLGNLGLGKSFEQSGSVQNAVMSFDELNFQMAKTKVANLCSSSSAKKTAIFHSADAVIADVTWNSGLFAVGHSTFFRNASCLVSFDCCSRTFKLECNDHFYIRDKFQDPLDGREFFHHPFELPGGTPYAINYDFFRISRKVENFSICSICSKKFGLLYV